MAAQELPTDIITNILCRVPVKPILRFKCVSKAWHSLINSLHFIKLHLTSSQTSNTNRHLIMSHSSLSLAAFDTRNLRFSELNHPLKAPATRATGTLLLGSCNGILCISNMHKDNVYLYNPLTNSRKRVPPSNITWPHHTLVFGFGYDSSSGDYKVLRMLQSIGYGDEIVYNECKVYSLRNDTWKWVDHIPYYVHYRDCHGALVNEGLHYTVTKKELDVKFKFFVRFDIRTESFALVDGPEYDKGEELGKITLMLGQLGGCLCLLVDYANVQFRVDFWVMKEYGKKESWVRVFSMCTGNCDVMFYKIKPVGYSRDGERLLLRFNEMEFYWYDLGTKKLKRVRARGVPDEEFGAGDDDVTVAVFVGSLVSVVEDKVQQGGIVARKNKKK